MAVRRLPDRAGLGRAVGIGLAAGLILGVGGRLSNHIPGLLHAAGALGGPWLFGAFLAGAVARGRAAGALAGGIAIVFGTFVYYVLSHWVERRTGLFYAAAAGVGWSLVGTVIGALFGLAGGFWREGGQARAAAAGLMAGALVAESLLLTRIWDGPAAQRAVAVQLVVAGVLALALCGRARLLPITVAVASASTATLFIGELVVRGLLRTSGWAGA